MPVALLLPAQRQLNLRPQLRPPSRPRSRLPLKLLPPPRSQSPLPLRLLSLLRQRLIALLAVSMSANAMEAMATSAVASADQNAEAATVKAAVIAVLKISEELELHPADTAVTLAAQDAVMVELSPRKAALTVHALSRRAAPMGLAMSLSRRMAVLTVLAVDALMDPAAEDAEFAKARAVTDVLTDARNAEVMDAESVPAEDSSGRRRRLLRLSTRQGLPLQFTRLELPHLFIRLSLRLRHALAAEAKDAPDVATEATS